MTACCANCRYGEAAVTARRATVAGTIVCRRLPPLPIVLLGERFQPPSSAAGLWPRVSAVDWCGEHAMARTEGAG